MKRFVLPFCTLVVFISLSAGTAMAQLGACAVPTGPLRPDLIVDGNLLRAMMFVSEETFGPDSCTVAEGCVTAPGTHLVLRFMSSTPNIGQTDLFIGDPNQCIGSLFRFSECHQHLHFQEYADYRLWTVAGYQKWVAGRDLTKPSTSGKNAKLLADARANGELIIGRKQGFCIIDVQPFQFGNVEPGPPRYQSCGTNQGLKVGWADQYHPLLGCQFIQVTGVREGDYVLEDHVNPEHLFPESDFTNNASAVKIHFRPKQGRSGPSVEVID
ncbi:MAG TPA: lysyl oxidase family protein [Pyrinomonadaceae bacterium]|nr:lysyl oxidase family protein [Pyrinomonadaceae bacterium]